MAGSGARRRRGERARLPRDARGLDVLHALGVRHGDVKLANVTVVRDHVPRCDRAEDRAATLIDVDLASPLDAVLVGGTPRYLAPEVREGEGIGPPADLWVLGVVLAEILVPEIADLAEHDSSRAFGEGEIGAWTEALAASPRSGALAGPPREWIDDALRGRDRGAGSMDRLDPFGTSRWLVALVGPAAAA